MTLAMAERIRRPRAHAARPLRVAPVHEPSERDAEARAERVGGSSRVASAFARRCQGGCPGEGQLAPETAGEIERARAAGHGLTPQVRSFFEPRLRADLTGVRVHSDPVSAALARRVSARAFTVGREIFFGAGEYAPATASGRHVLAHELAHVVQHRSGVGSDRTVHRYATCETPEECPERERGEVGRARREPMAVGGVTGAGRGLLVWNFGIDSAAIKAGLRTNPAWTDYLRQMAANPTWRWQVLGFSDCRGPEGRNLGLRARRALSLFGALGAARSQIVGVDAAPLSDCIAPNATESGRAQNRSAYLRQFLTEVTFSEDDVEPVEAHLCGPEVTSWLIGQMRTNQDHPVIRTGREHRWARWVPVFNVGWTLAALNDFRKLVEPGGPWDFKRTQRWWRRGPGHACPTASCDRTVTLCGHCVNYDVPGNIHYAWVGRRMELAPWLLRAAPGPVQEGGSRGDDPPDTVAVNIGIAMADEGRTLCGEVGSKLQQLNLHRTEGCSECVP